MEVHSVGGDGGCISGDGGSVSSDGGSVSSDGLIKVYHCALSIASCYHFPPVGFVHLVSVIFMSQGEMNQRHTAVILKVNSVLKSEVMLSLAYYIHLLRKTQNI